MEISHIWIGDFSSDAPANYFAESYEDDDAPINRFAEEQGATFYDYDRVEITYLDASEASDVRTFIDGHSYSDEYLEAVSECAVLLGMEQINVFVIADKHEFDNPRSIRGSSYRLEYLGEFHCNT